MHATHTEIWMSAPGAAQSGLRWLATRLGVVGVLWVCVQEVLGGFGGQVQRHSKLRGQNPANDMTGGYEAGTDYKPGFPIAGCACGGKWDDGTVCCTVFKTQLQPRKMYLLSH